MDNWLKFRSRTQQSTTASRTPTVPSTPSFENGISPFEVHNFEDESRLRSSSKVPSILSFGKQNTPAADLSSFPSPAFSHENNENRAAQNVWHNPNSDQMIEALKVVMQVLSF